MIWQQRAALGVLLTALTMFSPDSPACAQVQSNQQAVAPNSAKGGRGFLDYALGRINPQDTDYGSEVAARRAMVVSETLDNLLFWSNVAAFLLFALVTSLHIFNLRSGEKREWIAAYLITELLNGRLSDQIEIAERTEQYNLLVEKHNAAMTLSSVHTADNSPSESRTELRTQRRVERLIDGPRTSTKIDNQAPSNYSARKPASGQDGSNVSDLQQQTLLLERRIEAMQNTEQNLKERLNQATVLLDQERQRNRTLKGA